MKKLFISTLAAMLVLSLTACGTSKAATAGAGSGKGSSGSGSSGAVVDHGRSLDGVALYYAQDTFVLEYSGIDLTRMEEQMKVENESVRFTLSITGTKGEFSLQYDNRAPGDDGGRRAMYNVNDTIYQTSTDMDGSMYIQDWVEGGVLTIVCRGTKFPFDQVGENDMIFLTIVDNNNYKAFEKVDLYTPLSEQPIMDYLPDGITDTIVAPCFPSLDDGNFELMKYHTPATDDFVVYGDTDRIGKNSIIVNQVISFDESGRAVELVILTYNETEKFEDNPELGHKVVAPQVMRETYDLSTLDEPRNKEIGFLDLWSLVKVAERNGTTAKQEYDKLIGYGNNPTYLSRPELKSSQMNRNYQKE